MRKRNGQATRGLLAAALAMLAIGFVSTVLIPAGSRASQLPSSGDQLYDRLASTINEDLLRHDYNILVPDDYIASLGLEFSSEPGRISNRTAREWKADYGQDPRYWQMCWLLRSYGSSEDYMSPTPYVCPAFISSWNSGIRDEASSFLMLDQCTDSERRTVTDYCRKAWPDNSYWHYLAAEQALQAGNWTEFVQAMQIGNATVRSDFPRPWPLAELMAGAALSQDADNEAVKGVLAHLSRSQRLGALRSPADPLELKDADELDASIVDDYIVMQVRLAGMAGNGLEQQWRPAVALSRLLTSPGLGKDWEPRQRERLEQQRRLASELAAMELPELFGMQFSAGTAGDSESEGEIYCRDQASWINTLHSYQLDLQRARARSAKFREISNLH